MTHKVRFFFFFPFRVLTPHCRFALSPTVPVGPVLLSGRAALYASPGHAHDLRAQFFKLFVERRTRAMSFVRVMARVPAEAVTRARAVLGASATATALMGTAAAATTAAATAAKAAPDTAPEAASSHVQMAAIVGGGEAAGMVDRLRDLGAGSVVVIRCESIYESGDAE
jgi:hypothetical protein